MIYKKVDIKKSKIKGQVIFEEHWFFSIFDFVCTAFMMGVIVYATFMNINKNGYSIFSISFLLFSVILFYMVFYSLLNNSRLRTLNGISDEKNRLLTMGIVTTLNWNIKRNNSQYIVLWKDYDWFSWDFGKQIIIIFSDNKIFINCLSFGRGNLKSPFHWFVNRRIENRIITKLQLELQKEKNNR